VVYTEKCKHIIYEETRGKVFIDASIINTINHRLGKAVIDCRWDALTIPDGDEVPY